jgi:hypothetical protein
MEDDSENQAARIHVAIADPGREDNYLDIFEYLEENRILSSISTYSSNTRRSRPDILLASDEWCSEYSVKILEAKRNGIPVLHIVDGIVKWGNVWENPRSQNEAAGMPMFQPILADKIACIGSSQARLFCSWGQASKVAVTGLPRFDRYARIFNDINTTSPSKTPCTNLKRTILVIVANKPGYVESQVALARKSLDDLNSTLSQINILNKYCIIWRYGPRSPEVLPSSLHGSVENTGTLFDALAKADFVISSPSTATLEAMSMDIPTCIIDYLNKPEFIQAAWSIRSNNEMREVIESLLNSEENRMTYQRYLLHDQMRLDGLATPRVFALMQKMISISKASLMKGLKPDYSKIDTDPFCYSSLVPYSYHPEFLFPAHSLFVRSDTDELKAELGHLRLRVQQLENQITSLKWHVHNKSVFARSRRKASMIVHRLRSFLKQRR